MKTEWRLCAQKQCNGRERMGALWGGEAEEAKLQSSSVVYSDPSILTPLGAREEGHF